MSKSIGERTVRVARLIRLALLAFCIVGPGGARAESEAAGPSLGFDLSGSDAATLGELSGDGLWVRLTADWATVEAESGFYDWSRLEPSVASLADSGFRVALILAGSNPLYLPDGGPPTPLRAAALDAWVDFTRSAARTFAGRVEVFQIWDRVGAGGVDAFDASSYGFVLKRSALAVRSEARAAGSEVWVAQASLAADAWFWQRDLWAEDVAAYIDVLPVDLEPESMEKLGALLQENLRHPPASMVWARILPAASADPWVSAAAAVQALSVGAPVALVAESGETVTRWVRGAQNLLAGGFAPAPLGTVAVEPGAGEAGRALARFFSDESFSSVIFYSLPGENDRVPRRKLVLDTAFVRNARIADPVDGSELAVGSAPRPGDRPGRTVRVLSAPWPLALLFDKGGSSAFDLPPEEVETQAQRELSAAEIIARHQEVQKRQDDQLERWVARGRVDFHFKVAQSGSSFDVSIDSNYFWERGGELEWEQTDYYLNGNRLTWKNIPELPLIQPEKVITLPLDLTLDKTYAYRRVGRDKVEGRDAYVLEFQPVDPDAPDTLYRGKIWVDAQSFVRLKTSVIQTRLESPVLSNEEVDLYAPATGPGGAEYWMLSEIDGQQIWKAIGASFVVRRELVFRDVEINPPREDFERRRAEAYASSNRMLRDTENGFRYLEPQEDGTRTVKESVDRGQLFAAAGVLKEGSSDGLSPLVGVDYFNYDLFKKDIQFNAFMAGALGWFTLSKPDLSGGKLDLTANGGYSLLKFADQLFLGDVELESERVETRDQNVSLQLGVTAGQFVKFNLVGGLVFREFSLSDEANSAIAAFNTAVPANPETLEYVIPEDHRVLSGSIIAEFNRRGYTLRATGTRSSRSDWSTFGLRDTTSGNFGSIEPATGLFVPGTAEPVLDTFTKWSFNAFKEWYLPKFQKIRGGVIYLDGEDLDRFSRYQFNFFGADRLFGFAGTGVLFDRGVLARTGYSFNLFEAVRFDAAVENAWVEQDGSPFGRQSFTGLGLSGNVVGPWKTVINVNFGYALASDIPDLEGNTEFLVLVLKLF